MKVRCLIALTAWAAIGCSAITLPDETTQLAPENPPAIESVEESSERSHEAERGPELLVNGVDYVVGEWELRRLDRDNLPYFPATSTVPLEDPQPTDVDGIRVYLPGEDGSSRQVGDGGEAFYHPVGISLRTISLVAGWHRERHPAYIDQADAHLRKLLDEAIVVDDVPYLPYRFPVDLHGNPDDPMHPPWFSALAQGQALSAAVYLYEATGDDEYLNVADDLFGSFLRFRPADPWVVFVDDAGWLWLEEYPKDDEHGPLMVFNGHVFALYGLYDYWRVTGDEKAEELILAATATIHHYADDFRRPGQVSGYALRTMHPTPKYHPTHARQLRQLAAMTGDDSFVELAERFEDDWSG